MIFLLDIPACINSPRAFDFINLTSFLTGHALVHFRAHKVIALCALFQSPGNYQSYVAFSQHMSVTAFVS